MVTNEEVVWSKACVASNMRSHLYAYISCNVLPNFVIRIFVLAMWWGLLQWLTHGWHGCADHASIGAKPWCALWHMRSSTTCTEWPSSSLIIIVIIIITPSSSICSNFGSSIWYSEEYMYSHDFTCSPIDSWAVMADLENQARAKARTKASKQSLKMKTPRSGKRKKTPSVRQASKSKSKQEDSMESNQADDDTKSMDLAPQ